MQHILYYIVFIILFIVGMTFLRTGLFNASASSLRDSLIKLTDTPWKGLVVGTVVTGILQSSSAVMVITIGLISARILTFPQSIGIILGTNIGTTFTTEFITLNLNSFLVPLALCGAVFILFRQPKLRSMGFVCLGLAGIFAAMNGFEHLAAPLSTLPSMNEAIYYLNSNHLTGVICGAVVTAIIQSSTATTGIIMGFLTSNILDIDSGISIMLGANIGTCITAYIASIGSGVEARLCAYAHIWLNILGVVFFFPFIGTLSDFAVSLSSHSEVQLAHISVIFNVLSSIIVLLFANRFAQFIVKLHGVRLK